MAAKSSSSGLLVAPMTSTKSLALLSLMLSSLSLTRPSKAAKNSVLSLVEDSLSLEDRDCRMESTSSEKMADHIRDVSSAHSLLAIRI